jgi:release factor glutamine methyltransferase
VRFLQGCWYGPADALRFHAIIANPPYVAEGDPLLAALAHEPRTALVAGPEGLDALAEICAGARQRLAAGGMLIVEHGASQDAAVRSMMAGAGFGRVATLHDLAGLPRATRGSAD